MNHIRLFLVILLSTVAVAASGSTPDTISVKKIDIDEVVVAARKTNKVTISNQRLIKSIPAVMGEYDVIKYIASLPGVVSLSVLDPNFYVRGGAGYENRYYVSGFPVASPQHLSGILSLFDPYILRNSTLYKSGYPAQYSGVLSSYLNMFPSMERDSVTHYEISVGLTSSSARTSIPIGRGDALLNIAARYSYLEAMMKLIDSNNITPYSYGDITTSYSQSLGQQWRLKLFGIYSNDDLTIDQGVDFKWFNHSFNGVAQRQDNRSTLTLAAGVWGGERRGNFDIFISAPLHFADHNARGQVAYDYSAAPNTTLSAGGSFEISSYIYGTLAPNIQSYLYNGYISANHTTAQGIHIEGGVNVEQYFGHNSYTKILPRLRTSYDYNEKGSVWIDYARTAQYTTLLTSLSVPSPADIIMPIKQNLNPTMCDQISIGADNTPLGWLSLYGAVFFRRYTDAKEVSNISLAQSISNLGSIEYTSGDGEAHGVEFELSINHKRFNARANYTFTDSWRQLDKINGGKRYRPPFDITHNIVVTGEYRFSDHIKASAMWQYSSGVYITFPTGVAVAENIITGGSIVLPIYDDIYNYQLPATHRLDVSAEYSTKGWSISAGVYNAYNQNNISYIDYSIHSNDNYSSYIVPRGLTILPIIPYISTTYRW